MTNPARTYTHVWRIRHKPTGNFRQSGNSLYAKNTRSLWAGFGQAKRAYDEMKPDYRADCEFVKYELVEVGVVDPLSTPVN